MTFRKLAAVLLMTAILFGATSAWAIDYKTSIALALGSNGNIAGEAYTLTVPETLKVSKKGWNPMDDIHVVKDGEDFSKEKKLVVTASSTNNFALKSGENSISYTLTTAENGAQTTVWEFSAAEINAEGGTGKGIGITVTWDETQAAGKYEDEITYTAEVADAETTITVTWNNDDITGSGNSFTKDGVTITANYVNLGSNKTFMNGGTFTTTLGNFTKIEITASDFGTLGTGWTVNNNTATWEGDASKSVSFSNKIAGLGFGVTFTFTITPTSGE